MKSGFLFISKKLGISSHAALADLKRRFAIKKLGHHGTLDPFATGLLLVGIGEATKFFRFIEDEKKTYRATMKLGVLTDTLDLTGKVVEEKNIPALDPQVVKNILTKFLGRQMQVPPLFSAIKMGGERLYEKARRGETVERAAREVLIHDLQLENLTQDELHFSCSVSRGTYVRQLASDIAMALGTVGHLTQLARVELSGHTLSQAWDGQGDFADFLLPIENLLQHWPQIQLDEIETRRFIQGQIVALELSGLIHPPTIPFQKSFQTESRQNEDNGFITACYYNKKFIGMGMLGDEGRLKAERLLSVV